MPLRGAGGTTGVHDEGGGVWRLRRKRFRLGWYGQPAGCEPALFDQCGVQMRGYYSLRHPAASERRDLHLRFFFVGLGFE